VIKIKALLENFAKKNELFRRIARTLMNLKGYIKYKIFSIGQNIDNRVIIFTSFSGKNYSDSPKAIYEELVKNEEYNDFTFVWGFKEPKNYKWLEQNRNTVIVQFMSKEYQKYLAKAKYWIFNFRVFDYIYPKKEQVFIECWHGTPLKRLGYDIQNTTNAMNSQKEIKKRYSIDAKKIKYFISPSRFASEKFISAWNLKKVKKENIIIEEGYPRNDFLYKYNEDDIKRIKEKLGIMNDTRKVIFYAPTWRDNQHTSNVGYTYKTEVDFDKLQHQLSDKYIILFRAHYLVANSFKFDKYDNFIYDVSSIDDINELYVISDMLITDYSSVFFDYANLKRPMIFYMYDLESYRDDIRGFYFDISKLPGKIVKTENELIEEILNTLSNDFNYDDNYRKFNEKYNYLKNSNATERIIKKEMKNEKLYKKTYKKNR